MSNDEDAIRRLQVAGELHRAGVKLYRMRMRREHPGATQTEIDALVRDWLRTRPGAEHGDAVGRVLRDHPLLESGERTE